MSSESTAVHNAKPGTTEHKALLVCRSPELRVYIQKGLCHGEIDFFTVTRLAEASDLLKGESAFDSILVEIEDPLPEASSQELRIFCQEHESAPVIAIAPNPSAELVREVMILGVRDVLTNPFNRGGISETVLAVVARSREQAELDRRGADVPARARAGAALDETPEPANTGYSIGDEDDESGEARSPSNDVFITKNKKMIRILELLDRVAPTDSTVLIEGESGTGKEVIARRIHNRSKRESGPFVEVHCGAIPESLLESQLFGHEKGSFTGAFSRQIGLFEIANNGTIFLDEIAEMNLEMQVKLLRVLQERSFRRIGGRHNQQVNVRVVAATNRDLKEEVESKRFRADLYYRLNVISVQIPPVRERLEDIPELVKFFNKRFHEEKGLPLRTFPASTIEALQRIRWVGNVREIENAVERLILLSAEDEVRPEDIDEHVEGSPVPVEDSPFEPTLTLDEIKKIHIGNVLKANGGNKMKSARILGINVKTLYNLIQKLDIPT